MICKSLNELRQMVEQQASAIRNDVATFINTFMQQQRTNVDELAQALGLNSESITALINRTRDMTLKELITFLIASDKVINIEDFNTAMGKIHRQMPPMPPFNGFGGENQPANPCGMFGRMPQGCNVPPPTEGNIPPFMGNMPPMPPIENRPSSATALPDFDEMGRSALVDWVRKNVTDWEGSIDLSTANRNDIIEFINSIPEEPAPSAATQELPNNYEEVGRRIMDMAQGNPQLADMLKNIMKN